MSVMLRTENPSPLANSAMRLLSSLFCLLALLAAPISKAEEADPASNASAKTDESPADNQLPELMAIAGDVAKGKPRLPLLLRLDEVLKAYEARYAGETGRIYGARTPAEGLMYLLNAARDERSAIVIKNGWGDGLYLKGYVLVELGRHTEAAEYLSRAIQLSPMNSQYLSEAGHVQQATKQWQLSIRTFTAAKEAAENFSPEERKPLELARALRGIGFSLIELGQLDEAEAQFKESQQHEPRNRTAMSELQYIAQLRKAMVKGSPVATESADSNSVPSTNTAAP
jgi:tetratricopeptide (TPR) repeat protein